MQQRWSISVREATEAGFLGKLRYLSALLIITIASLIPTLAAANHHEFHERVRTDIIVGSELDYPPYALINEKGKPDGFSVDLIKAVAREMGIKIRFRTGPWSEMRKALEERQVDALPLVGYTAERDRHFDFTKPHTISYGAIFKRSDSPEITALEALFDKTVITLQSDNVHDYLLRKNSNQKLITKATSEEVLKALAAGEADYAVMPRLVSLLLIQQNALFDLEITGPIVDAYGPGYGFAVHEGDALLLALLNQGLSVVKASGEYDRIYNKWFGIVDKHEPEIHSSELIHQLLFGLLIIVALLLFMALWSFSLRRKVEERTAELRASEIRFLATFEEAAIGLAHVATDGSWLRVNQALCRMIGYSEAELLKLTFQDITHPDDLDSDLGYVQQMLDGEIETYSMEKRYFHKCGHIVWINLTVSLVRNDDGSPDYFISAIEDISDRKALDLELDRFFELVPDLVCVASADGRFLRLNGAWERVLGFSKDALMREPFIDFVHPDDRARTLETAATATSGEVVQFTNRYRCADETYKWFEWASVPGSDGSIYAMARDISDRMQMHLEVVKERNLAKKYLDVAAVMMVALDRQGKITLINRRGLEILGFSEDELIGRNWFERCIPEEDVSIVEPAFEKIMSGELEPVRYYENRVKTVTGAYRTLSFHNSMITNAEGEVTGLLSSGTDITDQLESEARLKKLSQALEQSGEAVIITDILGLIEYVNPAFTKITGYSIDEALGNNPRMLKSGKHDDTLYREMWQTLTAGEVWQGRVIDRRKDGSHYPVMLTISPVRSDEGVVTNYVGVQQNLQEYEELEARFFQSQKMEAIGTLVGGIAHDFNNTLAGITSNLYLAAQKVADADVKGRINNAERMAFSAAATIQQLLAFSRKGIVNMTTVPIAAFIKEAIKLYRATLPENIVFVTDIEDQGFKVRGDINQLQQMILNLLNNARDALADVDQPQISMHLSIQPLHHFEVVEQDDPAHKEVYICLEVCDNGCGIDPELRQRVFEPFFTTKPEGKGTGLGLSMVYGAVKSHHGWIFADPGADDVGTCMRIFLPLIREGEEVVPHVRAEHIVEGRGEGILLVDDNQMMREVGQEMLESINYRVMTAVDGLDAEQCYIDHADEIDLVLLDIIMPRCGGVEALNRLRKINPAVKVLFISGYHKSHALSDSDEYGTETIISKPYKVTELSSMIRQKIDEE